MLPYDGAGRYVSMKDAYDEWAPVAIALLVDTAKTYGGFVAYEQLKEFVQVETGTTHKGLITNSIGELLGRVIEHCLLEGYLSSVLCTLRLRTPPGSAIAR